MITDAAALQDQSCLVHLCEIATGDTNIDGLSLHMKTVLGNAAARLLMRLLNRVDKNHCAKSVESDEGN